MKNKLTKYATIALATLCGLAVSEPANHIEKTTLTDGVTWIHKTTTAPLNINILQVDVSDPNIEIETESANDKLYTSERVRDSVARESKSGQNVIAGTNADFWASGTHPYTPIGLLVADGMIYNNPSPNRSVFVLTEDEKPYIGLVTLDVTLKSSNHKLKIDHINSNTKNASEVVLFTFPYGDVEPAEGKRYLLKMKADEFLPNQSLPVSVSEIDSNSTTTLSKGEMVLFIPSGIIDKYKSLVRPGDAVLSAVLPQVKGVVRSVCGGGPQILEDGHTKFQDEKMAKSFATIKNPRTSIGFTKDKGTIYLVTVDGRQPKLSIGVTLKELADIMKDLGCWTALNLDGGGSTSMVVGNNYVNSPSDLAGPRPVANSLFVIKK